MHGILFLNFLAFSTGLVLISLTWHLQSRYSRSTLRAYVFHLVCMNLIGLGDMTLNYVIANLAPDKAAISSGYYNLFIGVSIGIFVAVFGNIAAFALTSLHLAERSIRRKEKTIGMAATGVLLLTVAVIAGRLFSHRGVDDFMRALHILDHAENGIILIAAGGLLWHSRRMSPAGRRVVLRGFGSFYAAVQLGFFVALALRSSVSMLFAYYSVAYYLALNLIPIFYVKRLADRYLAPKPAVATEHEDPDELLARYDVTRREKEIIELVCAGLSNQDIAQKLFISPKTVKFHIYNVYRKLGIRNRVELVNLVRSERQGDHP